MDQQQLFDRFSAAIRQDGRDAAYVIDASYVPAGGKDQKVFPPTYPRETNDDLPRYVLEPRMVDGQPTETVLLDSFQSQSNRVEEAISDAVADSRLTLPFAEITYDLPTGRTVRITSFDAPHRAADAYLRDAVIDGTPFDKTTVGQRLRSATPDDITPLYEREPLSLVLGMWDSHRRGRQLRLARLYRSEIIGIAPEVGKRAAGRMDPHNLVGAVKDAERATDGSVGWEHLPPEGPKVKGAKLSEIGHGNIAPQFSHGGVTVKDVRRAASVSFAGLARLRFGPADRTAAEAARVALAALALLGDRLAFARSALWLRSGCELVLERETAGFQQVGGAVDEVPLTADELHGLFTLATDRARSAGVAMSGEVVRLRPGKGLAKALDYAYLQAAEEGA